MTRINAGIRAIELCDSHLIRERIELLRIPNNIKSGKARVEISKIPKTFILGSGHVIFFYDKLEYLKKRYEELTLECQRRNFLTTDFSDSFKDLPSNLFNDWIETSESRELLIERINIKLQGMKNLKYMSKPVEFSQIKLT